MTLNTVPTVRYNTLLRIDSEFTFQKFGNGRIRDGFLRKWMNGEGKVSNDGKILMQCLPTQQKC